MTDLTLTFAREPAVTSVRSLRAAGYFRGHLHKARGGALEVHTAGDRATVNTRVDVVDFLLVD